MSKVLLYVPRERMTEPSLWQELRDWQKQSGVAWDKIRCTPASISESATARDEMKAALQLIRKGSFESVVFAELPQNYASNLEWLTFALSCQAQQVKLQTLAGDLALPEAAVRLAASYPSLTKPEPAVASRKRSQAST